jgi:apolipoprotein N-acyltransferase
MIFKKYDFLLILITILFTITGFAKGYSRYFCLIAFVSLFSYLFLISKEKDFKGKRKVIILSLLFIGLLISTIIDTTWLVTYSYRILFLAGILWGIFYFIYSIISLLILKNIQKKLRNPILISLILAGIYVLLSFIIIKIASFLFVLNWIHALYDLGFLINIFGINILMFVLVFYQALFAYFITRKNKRKYIQHLIISLLLFFMFVFVITYNNLNPVIDESGMIVALIQNNDYRGWEYNIRNAEEVLDYHLEMTVGIEKYGYIPDIIMWPEYSVPYPIHYNETMLNKIYNLSEEWNSIFMLGIKDVFESLENYNNINSSYYDAILIIYPNRTYDLQYQNYVPPEDSNKIPKEKKPKIIDHKGYKFGIMLCWDSHNLDYGKQYRNKVDYMLYFDSNAIFDNYLRAYEITSYMHKVQSSFIGAKGIRITSTGYSGIVDKNGVSIVEIEPFEPSVTISFI